MIRYDRRRQWLAIGLSALAGYVDAVGFLAADGYFVSFMSGNTTRLGVNLARSPAQAITPALLIGGFVLGVTIGAAVAIRAGAVRRKPAVLALVAVLLGLAAAVHAHTGHPGIGGAPGGPSFAGLALLVMAMGALNNTFQRDGEVAVGLTYMTGALVKLGQALGARLNGARRPGWPAWMALWCGLALGAVSGALIWSHAPQIALWAAFCWTLAMLAYARRLPASDG